MLVRREYAGKGWCPQILSTFAVVKSVIIYTALLGMSLFFALMLSETIVRVVDPQPTGSVLFQFHPELGAVPYPSQSGRRTIPDVYSYTFSNNSVGWRHSPEPDELGSDVRPVWFLGDSFTYGMGVDDGQTMASVYGKMTGSVVINSGNPGQGTDFALLLLDRFGDEVKPSKVVIAYFQNDVQDNIRDAYYHRDVDSLRLRETLVSPKRDRDRLAANPVYQWMMERSHLANKLRLEMVRFVMRRDFVVRYAADPEAYLDDAGLDATRAYMNAAAERIAELGAEGVVLYVPSREDVIEFRASGQVSAHERAWLSLVPAGLRTVSATRAFSESGLPLHGLFFSEGHWTAAGHGLAAEVVLVGR